MTPPAVVHNRILRECNCPPAVVRCSHIEGQCICLFDWELSPYLYWNRYHVCRDDGDLHLFCAGQLLTTDDIDFAHFEFNKAEEALLRGDA